MGFRVLNVRQRRGGVCVFQRESHMDGNQHKSKKQLSDQSKSNPSKNSIPVDEKIVNVIADKIEFLHKSWWPQYRTVNDAVAESRQSN